MKTKPYVFAVSGVKNSGKTTLITKLLSVFTEKGLKVATVKHDGHEFEADVPGTDSYRHFHAGAYGTVIFSDTKYMLVKKQPDLTEEEMIAWFPEADLIILEGFKYCKYPKIEVIRKGNSSESVCYGYNLKAIATDYATDELILTNQVTILDLNNPVAIADYLLQMKGGEE